MSNTNQGVIKNPLAGHLIPPMVHPLGAYWNQPPREQILVDEKHAIMNRGTFDLLAEYSTTFPSGIYEGKMWSRNEGDRWLLCWYEPSELEPGKCRIRHAEIMIL